MKIDVLVSTMNLENKNEFINLLKKMNIESNSIIINQCTKVKCPKDEVHNSNYLYSYNEKGLSVSRNKAIQKSNADICVIADDDMMYNNHYLKIIKDAYKKFPKADLIAFYVNSENPNNIKPKLKEGKVGILKSFKIQSVQLSFKRNSILNNRIFFDENFGAGKDLYMGEENIFILDCIKKGLKVYSYPVEIAKLYNRESTWFKGYDEKFFKVKGACFYRMSKLFWLALCVQFIIRKRNLYKNNFSMLQALKYMFIGKKEYNHIY